MKNVHCSESRHSVKVGPGPMDPGPRDPGTRDPGPALKFKNGTRDPLKFKSVTPGPSSKFKSETPRPSTKIKSGTFKITFLHCYIYNMEIIFHE